MNIKIILRKCLIVYSLIGVTSYASANSSRLEVYSEAGLWGRSMVREYFPANSPRSLIINLQQIKNEDLDRSISSFRLECGSRYTNIYLSDSANESVFPLSFKGNVVFQQCKPYQTIEINLHNKKSYPSNSIIADRVKSILVTINGPHETGHTSTLFSEAGFWGRELTIVAEDLNGPWYNRSTLARPVELFGMGLLRAVSSVKMSCNSRIQSLRLSNNSKLEKILTCSPYQTESFNLHNVWGRNGYYLGDAVSNFSAYTTNN